MDLKGYDVFVPSEARRKKKRQKSKDRKKPCVVVIFKLEQNDDDSVNIEMKFDSYQPKNQTANYTKDYVEKSQKQLPTKPRLGTRYAHNAFNIFNLFYPDYNPKDNPEKFGRLSLLIWNMWAQVEQIANDFENVKVEEYNMVRAENMDTAIDYIQELVREIKVLETLEKNEDGDYISKLCWAIKKLKY